MFGIDDMGAAIGGIAGAGASIFGGSAQNAANKQNAQDQFFYNLMLQQQAQAFNERMANTQYQRTMADMKAGGLNPILAAGGFSPDGASSGGQSSVSQAHSENVTAGAVSSATQLGKMLAELKQIDSHIQQNEAATGKLKGDTLAPGLASQHSAASAAALSGAAAAHHGSSAASHAQARHTDVQAAIDTQRLKNYKRTGVDPNTSFHIGEKGVALPMGAVREFSDKTIGMLGDAYKYGRDAIKNWSPGTSTQRSPTSAKDINSWRPDMKAHIRKGLERNWDKYRPVD